MPTSACVLAIRNFAEGRIADAILPSHCAVAEVVQAFWAGAEVSDATGVLGTERIQVRWRAIDSGIAGKHLRLWHDGQYVLAVELEAPRVVGDWDSLRVALGEPEAKFAYWKGVVESESGQWVYATRGIAVFVSLSEATLVRVMMFPPTSVAAYRSRLARALTPPREFPEP